MLERTDEGVCPYIMVFYCTEQITSQLVSQSTRQLYLIIILNYKWASASVDSHVPLGTLCRLAASCYPCILC
ncbi:hypothetical protein HMPREF0973_00047 [Prevotella veroralis F0319]|uniref:Uncharacterized protein n=1 Tax=Prevotella veroralis F0319 TaxID=649761 RepID=C9MKC8_9BACT|nr:hypothetical protein HMPREF0973_00047 [Prevotella veroralis F0319]